MDTFRLSKSQSSPLIIHDLITGVVVKVIRRVPLVEHKLSFRSTSCYPGLLVGIMLLEPLVFYVVFIISLFVALVNVLSVLLRLLLLIIPVVSLNF